MANAVSEDDLKAALGKHISAFCDNAFIADKDEHCAHFVAHMLDYRFGLTCATMGRANKTGANLRVQEIWPRCMRVGTWADLAYPPISGLVFIGNAGNIHVAGKKMDAVSRLHIGIFYGTDRTIYHYSNAEHRVIAQTPTEFSKHYPAPDNAMFWGDFVL